MFQCIPCTKPSVEEDADERQVQSRGESSTQRPKSFTAQIKDMALKITGACKQKSTGTGSNSTHQRGLTPNAESEANSEGVQNPYMGGANSGSTTARDFRENVPSGNQTPRHRLVEVVPGSGEVEPNQWMAQVEPGVHVTLIALSNGGNELRRIRFDREMFDRRRAQIWWGQNYDRLMELYNVRRFNQQSLNNAAYEDEQQPDFPFSRQPSARDSPVASWLNNDANLRNLYYMEHGSSSHNVHAAGSSVDADELSFGNAANETVGEWIEQDEPGVFITIRVFPDGTKELRRVRFSRQRFGDDEARVWWDANMERIQAEYL